MASSNTVIGLDFGSHTALIALFYEDKQSIEVLADELGSRTIPCVVAFRGDSEEKCEVLVGQSALSQQHKNPNNTFSDLRAMLLNKDIESVHVPVLQRDIPVTELVSHFFRNIHNQIKQQLGRVERDCVISVPSAQLEESVRQRLIESAQAGGLRIKAIVQDSLSTLVAYGQDDCDVYAETATVGSGCGAAGVGGVRRVLVVDIGWSSSDAAVYEISQGVSFELASVSTEECSGKVLVKNLSEHCAKDFMRRSKQNCMDSSRSMIRLRAQCEEAVKHMSTGQEATIDIDSLFEGIDYSGKITRARFEDLASIPLLHLKTLITQALTAAHTSSPPRYLDSSSSPFDAISTVCLSGGVAAMPKLLTMVKSLFAGHASVQFPKLRVDPGEALCVGAAAHGRHLLELGLMECAPSVVPPVPILPSSLYLATPGAAAAHLLLVQGCVLPASASVQAQLPVGSASYFSVLANSTPLANLVVPAATAAAAEVVVVIAVTVSKEGAVEVSVASEGTVLTQCSIPAPASA